jgi:hypothetical protein
MLLGGAVLYPLAARPQGGRRVSYEISGDARAGAHRFLP